MSSKRRNRTPSGASTRGRATPAAVWPIAAQPPGSQRGLRIRVALILLAGVVAYANSLAGPLVFDDLESVVENRSIHEWWRLKDVLHPVRELPVSGRPLVNLSFAFNYAAGGLDVRGYRLVNISIHLACALLMFAVVRRTLDGGIAGARLQQRSADLAWAAALLWTVHPLNSEAVDYLTQRTETMMALCYLLTIYASIRAATPVARARWSSVAILACAAGMGCKESMVTAPVMVVLYDRVFLFDSLGHAVKARWKLYAGLAAAWVVLAVMLWSGPRVHSAGFSTGVTPWAYLLNQAVMIVRYVQLAVWPGPLVVNYGWPRSLTIGDVLPQALAVSFLLAATFVALRKWPALGFTGAWFFLTLAPTSSVVPIATEVGAERRMYLPLMAVVVVAVVAAAMLSDALRERAAAPPSRLHA